MGQATKVEQLYSCTPPTKIDCDLFVMLGTSLMNGYNSTMIGEDSQIISYYFPTGNQAYCERYGTIALQYDTPNLNFGQFLYMNKAYNYQAGSERFGPDSLMAKELYANYNWPRPLFFFHHEQNGASLIGGETSPDWTIAGTVYPVMIVNLQRAVNILKSRGYNPRISIMWGSGAAISTTATDYQTAINALIAGIRTAVEDNTIRFLWGKPTILGAAPALAYRAGLDLVMAADNLVTSFDYDLFVISGDMAHPTTLGNASLGLIFAGYWYEKYYSNNRPVASGVTISGTLKNGQPITANYTYTDTDTENTTVVADTYRLRHETGSRWELFTASDAIGTNKDYATVSRNKGETYTLNGTHIGKYLRIVVFPKAQVGSIHGYPVESAWQGPVIA